ncbi:hypothetical protein LCGC14_1254290 [marine sediment metagenome]|uniref:Leucine-rich repeat domain-containing protein n=1 Tax=marine sediment metagenome TaxID=412755 RepID=A0A0F9NJ65_9ZZZZ
MFGGTYLNIARLFYHMTMNSSKEFRINEFLSLKLEEGKTNIYVNGNLFRTCVSLILNIPIDEVEYFDETRSIDEAAEKTGWSEDKQFERYNEYGYMLSPEEEFLGHCSNLQVWYEHGYDTRLLHYSLSFSLLSVLSHYDPVAKSVFKEELAKRYESGCKSVVNFLRSEFDISVYLTQEEILHIELVPEEAEILLDVEPLMGIDYPHRFISGPYMDSPRNFIKKNKHVTSLIIGNDSNLDKNPEILEKLSNLKHLEYILVGRNNLSCLPKSMTKLENLIYLDLSGNRFTDIPPVLKTMKSLQFVDLSENKIPYSHDGDYITFKNTFVKISYPNLLSRQPIQDMYRILEGKKSCNLQYLTEFVVNLYRADRTPPKEIFKRLLEYHRKKIEKKGTELVYNNGIVSLK